MLADLGAAVDKVEEVSGGDYVRHMPPLVPPSPADAAAGDQSAFFLALNRGKRSIALDLKKKSAVAAVLRMAARYDVLLEQFRPGVLARLGLSTEALRERNPKLIVCALTGYGQDGPLAHRAGHDIDYLARAGVLGQQGPAEGPPQIPGFQLADVGGGLWSVVGILAALAKRDRTGEGATVDVVDDRSLDGLHDPRHRRAARRPGPSRAERSRSRAASRATASTRRRTGAPSRSAPSSPSSG